MEFYRRALRIREEEIDRKKSAIDATVNALRQDPEYVTLERNYRSAQFALSKLKAQEKDIAAAENALKVAQTAFFDKLSSMGKSIKDITYTPTCPICNDRGHTIGGACKCLIPTIKECMVKEGDLLHTLSDYQAFDLAKYDDDNRINAEKLLSLIKKWEAAYPNTNKHCFVIAGKPGVGKTHLASIVANRFLDRGKTVSFYNAITLNKIFLRAYLAPLSEKSTILSDVYDTDLLVIDDLGIEPIINNVTKEYIYELLNERSRLATIITTNLEPDAIQEKYDGRIFSRLTSCNSFVTTLIGKDLRRK